MKQKQHTKHKIIMQGLAIAGFVLGLVGLSTYASMIIELDHFPIEIWALLPAFVMGFYVLGFMAITGYPPDLDAPRKKLLQFFRR